MILWGIDIVSTGSTGVGKDFDDSAVDIFTNTRVYPEDTMSTAYESA